MLGTMFDTRTKNKTLNFYQQYPTDFIQHNTILCLVLEVEKEPETLVSKLPAGKLATFSG